MFDYIEKQSYILFIPGVFLEDCLDKNEESDSEEKMDFSSLQPENIDLIDEELEEDHSEIDYNDLPERGLELNDLLEEETETHEKLEKYVAARHENIKYELMPKYFIDAKTWIKSINILCCFCHNHILGIPRPIALTKTKMLVPENEETSETIISLIKEKEPSKRHSEFEGDLDKNADDNLLFSNRILKETKAYVIHFIACCDIGCAGNYIRKVNDPNITNKKESLQMTLEIESEISGEDLDIIPDKDLWIVMEQYRGYTGQKPREYLEKNLNKEIKLKQSMKNNY